MLPLYYARRRQIWRHFTDGSEPLLITPARAIEMRDSHRRSTKPVSAVLADQIDAAIAEARAQQQQGVAA